jgi:UDP-apiose/xylose synthase
MPENKGSNRKVISIFGAGGFIGSHLVKSLLAEMPELDVICIDRVRDKLERIAGHGGYQFISNDIRKANGKIDEIIEVSDYVIDLIAYANPHIYLKRPIEVIELNLFDNLKIVDLCLKHGKYLMQFSTCEVYGITGGSTKPFNEDNTNLILGPIRNRRWVYSCAKQLLERMVNAKGLDNGLNYSIVRPFNFIGPEMDFLIKSIGGDHPRVFPHFMSSLLFDNPMYLVDGGLSQRTFTYIDDAISGIICILQSGKAANREIFNIGTPDNETTIRDFGLLMRRCYEELTGKKSRSKIVPIDSNEFYGEGYEDCDRRIPDVKKLTSLGWTPKFGLEESVKKSILHYITHVKHLK